MATVNEMTFRIAGAAGQGVESSGAGFAESLGRAGLCVFGVQDYMSRIRGGLNYFQVRVSEQPLLCHEQAVHLLLPLNEEAFVAHRAEVVPGGGVLYDEALRLEPDSLGQGSATPMPIPLTEIAKEHGDRVMINTAALGAAAGVVAFSYERIADVIRRNFRRKGGEVVAANLRVARAAYLVAQERYSEYFPWKLGDVPSAPSRVLLSGNQALAMGALAGGCRFVSAYPMTPATSIIEWMARHEAEYGIVTKHAEDEIAAINMAIGANFVGVRGMTATSGGGFSLMAEALGLAGMCEVPVVVVLAQRGGPSTGLPTRTEQSDLLFALHASQGEFPRIVLAPGTVEECFECGWRAFNLAEQYQTPVIVLSDQLLASSLRSVEWRELGFDRVVIDRGSLLSPVELDTLSGPYMRHRLSPDGISPRALPGHPRGVFASASDEHDEYGHITEDAENRRLMMSKRMRKLGLARRSLRPPAVYGPEDADVVLVGWGSTFGVLKETVDRLGGNARLVHYCDLWPFPAAESKAVLGQGRVVVVENNYTAQFAALLQSETCIRVQHTITRYDGRPFSPEDVIAGLQKER